MTWWIAATGLPVGGPGRRERLIDRFAAKVEEWADRSKGHVRADVVHERLVAVGFAGDERTTRGAVAEAKTRWRWGAAHVSAVDHRAKRARKLELVTG